MTKMTKFKGYKIKNIKNRIVIYYFNDLQIK